MTWLRSKFGGQIALSTIIGGVSLVTSFLAGVGWINTKIADIHDIDAHQDTRISVIQNTQELQYSEINRHFETIEKQNLEILKTLKK